jgi:hypothetical protein
MAGPEGNKKETKENLETYSLIWLDGSVNNSQQNIRAQKKLRTSIHHLLTFEDDQKCLQHIQSLTDHDRVVLMVSGRLGEIIVPKIAHLRQVTSVYVYCIFVETHKQWAEDFSVVNSCFIT